MQYIGECRRNQDVKNEKLNEIARLSGMDIESFAVRVSKLANVKRAIIFGSYAKGLQSDKSDIDIAVFFDTDDCCRLNEYKQLVKIACSSTIDVQVQAFSVRELDEPIGIIGEILEFGVELPLLRGEKQ